MIINKVLLYLLLTMLVPSIIIAFVSDFYRSFIVKTRKFNEDWRQFLDSNVLFYSRLSSNEKERFERKIIGFFYDYKIKGHDTAITMNDKLLVAASGVIPVFAFDYWEYENLETIFLLEDSFTMDFEAVGGENTMNGLVGQGFLKDKMYLSKRALHKGFANEKDHRNTAIHEFVHLIDFEDGAIDGLPEVLLEQQYVIPWIDLMEKEIQKIWDDDSEFNDYAGTNRMEFFAEVSVFFFEDPDKLQKSNPELYALLKKIYMNNKGSIWNQFIDKFFKSKK